jgi:hypothetical protein
VVGIGGGGLGLAGIEGCRHPMSIAEAISTHPSKQ